MNYDSKVPERTGYSQQEYDALLQHLLYIGSLFRSIPTFMSMEGYEVSPSRDIIKRPGNANNGPVQGQLNLRIYKPEYHRNNPSRTIRFRVNDPWIDGTMIFEDDESGIYVVHHEILEQSEGYRHYRSGRNQELYVLYHGRSEPWIPVSQERWIRALIARSTAALETQLQSITNEKQTRLKRINQGYERMARLDKEEASKFRDTQLQNEEIYDRQAAAIQDQNWDALEAAGQRGLAIMGRNLHMLKQELSTLSPAERASAAYGLEYDANLYWSPPRQPARSSLLLDKKHQKAVPLLAPNPDFFRQNLPSERIQVVSITSELFPELDSIFHRDFDMNQIRLLLQ